MLKHVIDRINPDSATSMVEIIWPRRDSSQCKRALGQGPLTTRIYIEETLRRSRTSYSTLQVALYYLILFKHNMPTAESPSMALQCGRRMFLAALILASKYLQDRNYSAKAWSKMCGLNTSEINHNERNFLRIVDWNLHIPDRVFKRWTDVVLRFTTSQLRGSTPLQSQLLWRQVIPFLTPELDDPRLPISSIEDMGCPTPETGPSSPNGSFGADRQEEVMPAPAFIQPPSQVPVAPYPAMTPAHSPETPGLRRMGLLPTPSLTPSTVAASTPTVSVCGLSERHASYRESALACLSRCGSLAPSVFSLASSPESMITDTSSLASSHSSVAMSAAPQWPSLAITATRLVTEPSKPLRRSTRFQGTARKPIYIEEPQFGGHIDLTQSSFTVEGQTVCTSARKRALPITLCDETIVDANDDEVLVLGDASGSQEPGSLTSAELADPSVSRKRICPSRLSPLRLGGALPTTPPGSTSPEPPTKRPRTGLAPPSTPPKSTSASPDLLVKVGPNEWSVMAD